MVLHKASQPSCNWWYLCLCGHLRT
jgi:hypothetical protein